MGQFFLRLFSKVTFLHKLTLIGILMLLSLVICIFYIQKNLESKISKVSAQIENIQNGKIKKIQLDQLSHHAFLVATGQEEEPTSASSEWFSRFTSLVERLRIRLLYHGIPLFQTDWIPYYLTNLGFVELPSGQILISKAILSQSETEALDDITLLKAHLENLSILNEATTLGSEPELANLIDHYRRALADFIPRITAANKRQSSDIGMKALRENFIIWGSVYEKIDEILIKKLKTFQSQKRWIVAGSFFLGLLGLLIALLSFFQAKKPLTSMLQAIQKFKAGDFTIRIPITYKDEIGGFSILLNQLGDQFEEKVKEAEQTKQLLEAQAKSITETAEHLEMHAQTQEIGQKQISDTAKEISNKFQEFFCMLKTINTSEDETTLLANTGKGSVIELEQEIIRMTGTIGKATSLLTVMNDKVQSTALQVATMGNVVRHTNLLSINAAIQAEKAGEQGKGFSVISREIRHLAEQSGQAVQEIEKVTKDMGVAISTITLEIERLKEKAHQAAASARTVGDQLWGIQKQGEMQKNSIDIVDKSLQAQSKSVEKMSVMAMQMIESSHQIDQTIKQFLNK